MWSRQHSIVTDASKEQIWKLWSDMDSWSKWNPAVDQGLLNGQLQNGIGFILKFHGIPKIGGVIRKCEYLKGFANVGWVMFLCLNIELWHEMRDTEGGVKLTHQVKVSGPLSSLLGGMIGRKVSKRFPEAMESLTRLAKQESIRGWHV